MLIIFVTECDKKKSQRVYFAETFSLLNIFCVFVFNKMRRVNFLVSLYPILILSCCLKPVAFKGGTVK